MRACDLSPHRGPWPVGLASTLAVLLLATASPWLRSAQASPIVLKGAHYELHYVGEASEADEALRVLEAAYPQLEMWFGDAPRLRGAERLVVRYFQDQRSMMARIEADGAAPPLTAGGYYWPGSRTAYVFKQPTTYFTRTLLIHEAVHQFHFLARTRNRSPVAEWYTEGVAEFLSWHQWDGERLRLGVAPGISLKDYAAKALKEASHPDFKLDDVVRGHVAASRALSWALFRYLATGRDGKPLRGFSSFCKAMDRRAGARQAFKASIGQVAALTPRFRAWLAANQAAWSPVFNEWEQIADRSFRGYADVVTACRLKNSVTQLKASVSLSRCVKGRVGLLLHWTSGKDYTVATIGERGQVQVRRRSQGRWIRVADVACPSKNARGVLRWEAYRQGTQVRLVIEGTPVGTWELPGNTLGLAAESCDCRFADVEWD